MNETLPSTMTSPQPPSASGAAMLAAFTLAIFTSAFLLFAIQPMFTKMVLPQLGGSPAVWSVAMVFFQGLLLAGYLYAHLSTRYLTTRVAALVHLVVLLITMLTLPIGVSSSLGAPPAEGQAGWLIGVFLLSVGLPFFAVAGNGPLLQAWFSRSGHAHASDPYFLYGASNLGSFAALLLYPVLFEPLLRVREQSFGWSAGFMLLTLFIAICAFMIRNANQGKAISHAATAEPKPEARAIISWIALSFIPSGLLVAVTAHLSTDVAAAPFLWVIPLALFLLTFVLIFREKPLLPIVALERILPILAGGLVLFSYFGSHMFVVVLLVHCGFFFVATVICHNRLYGLRPAAEHLTAFYLWMSFGGVLGGLFAGLIAPLIFNRVLEYPILVVASVLALPAIGRAGRREVIRWVLPILLAGGAAILALLATHGWGSIEPETPVYLTFLGFAGLAMLLYSRPLIVAAMLPMLFITLDILQNMQGGRAYSRSFFGVHKVETQTGGQFRVLSHGTTIHGAMRILNEDGTPVVGRPRPLTYYHPEAPIAETLNAAPGSENGRTIGVVGLGAGAHVCNGTERDRWTYFEIDASVERIARDPKLFRFLSVCAPQARIVLGDARLTLAREPQGGFDNLLIDAFSSDAIPMHLMTREALALYLKALKPDGILTMHISNRHLELESVVGALAKDAKVEAVIKYDNAPAYKTLDERVSSVVVAMARNPAALAALTPQQGWNTLQTGNTQVWTDDYSNILGSLWRRYATRFGLD